MSLGRTRSGRVGATLLVMVTAYPFAALAERRPAAKEVTTPNKAQAAALYKKSADAYLRGDFTQSIALLDEAYALDPQPVLLYNKARAHEGLGHVDDAIALYEEYLTQEPTTTDRGAIEQRLITLRHQRDERAAIDRERLKVDQDRSAVEKERAATPPPPPPPRRSVVPYVVMGVGAAALVGGAVFGVLAKSRESDGTAEPVQLNAVDLRDQGQAFAAVSNIAFIAGGVLLATGAVWWFVDRANARRKGTAVGLGVAPGFIHLGGTFQ